MANRTEQRINLGGSGGHGGRLFNLFTEYLQPESYTTAAQVANNISLHAPITNNNDKAEIFLYNLWVSIFGFAEQIPYDDIAQDKLVNVVRELMLLPDNGIMVGKLHMWADLPEIAGAFWEYQNSSNTSRFENIQIELDQEWTRYHAFGARLIGAGMFHCKYEPIRKLRNTLEKKILYHGNSNALDRELSTAAVYIEFAGPVLVEALANNPHPVVDDDDKQSLGPGPLFEGEPGLTMKRWLFWEKRFSELAEDVNTSEAKDLALRAANLMKIWRRRKLEQAWWFAGKDT